MTSERDLVGVKIPGTVAEPLCFGWQRIFWCRSSGLVFSEGGVGGNREALKDQWGSLGWNVTPLSHPPW